MTVYFWGEGNLTHNCVAKIDNSIVFDHIHLLRAPSQDTGKVLVLAKRRSRGETVTEYLETLSEIMLEAKAIGFQRVIFLSSFTVFGPSNEYRKEKILAECLLEKISSQNKIQFTIIRLPNVIGFAKDASIEPYTLVGQLIYSAKTSGRLVVDSIIDEFRYFIHVDRLIEEISQLSHQSFDNKILHLLEYREIKVKLIVDLVAEIFKVPIQGSTTPLYLQDKGLNYPENLISQRDRSNLKSNDQLLELVSRLIYEEASLF